MTDISPRDVVVLGPIELNELSPGSVVHLGGMRKPIYRECSGEWMSTHVPGKPVYDYLEQDGSYPGQVIFRADPLPH